MNKQLVVGPVLASVALVFGVARAAPAANADDSANSRPPAQPELCVQIISGPNPLDAESVHSAIEKELGVKVTSATTATSIGTVRVEAGRGSSVTIGFASADGRTQLKRRIALPVDPSRRVTVIAWIVGNLVRNEADEILLGMLGKRTSVARDESALESSPMPTSDPTESTPNEPVAKEPVANANAPQPPPAPPEARPSTTPAPSKPAAAEPRDRDLGPPQMFHAALFSPTLAVPTDAVRHAFYLSLSAGYGRVGGLDGFGLGLFVDRVEYRSRGVQMSTLWIDTNEHEGVLLAGIGTSGRGSLQGTELTGGLTLRTGCVRGAQITGIWASTLGSCAKAPDGVDRSALQGLQMAGAGAYVRGGLEGVQIGGVVAIASGRNDGLQMGGALAYSGAAGYGVQIAGANVTNAALQGLQLSGAFNYQRGASKSAQITGGVNVSNDVEGAQIGVVNVARDVDGLQFGVVNVARHNRGVALGLFNWSEGARVQPIVFFQNPGYFNAGYRTLSGYSTGTISFGYDPSNERARTHFATGPRFAYDRFAFGAEFGYGWVLEHMKSKPTDRAHELDLIAIASAEVVRNVVTVYGGAGVVLPVSGVVAIEPNGLVQGGLAFF